MSFATISDQTITGQPLGSQQWGSSYFIELNIVIYLETATPKRSVSYLQLIDDNLCHLCDKKGNFASTGSQFPERLNMVKSI